MSRQLKAMIPNVVADGGIAYIATEILDAMQGDALSVGLWCIHGSAVHRSYLRPAVSRFSFRVACRFGRWRWLEQRARRKFRGAVRAGDIAYFWPAYDLDLIQDAKASGAVVVAERVNCMGGMVRRTLEPAYRRLGRQLPTGWCDPASVEEERRQMAACDFVFAPNRQTAESLAECGIPAARILRTSYGWSPARFGDVVGWQRPERDPTFVFIGSGSVRKGLPVLLEAWEAAGIRGRLLLLGKVDADVMESHRAQLERADVVRPGFTADLRPWLRQSDVFVFPSNEEGGPLVAYETAGCGLASIVSPMGAGDVVRDGQEGLVLDPLDVDAWVAGLRRLASDGGLRRRMAASAALRAQQYTWSEVGVRRREQLLAAVAGRR